MSCYLKHKNAIDNLKSDIEASGFKPVPLIGDNSNKAFIEHNKKVAIEAAKIQAVVDRWNKSLPKLGLTGSVVTQITNTFIGDLDSVVNVLRDTIDIKYNENLLDEIDDIRKALGIYDSKLSYASYQKQQEELFNEESDILEEEVVEEPELEVPSHLNIDAQTYQNMVNMRRGSEPDMFISDGRKYVMNPRGYYNLIDQYTNNIILKDINLKTKQTILNFEQTVDLETLRDRKRYVIKVISTEVNENDLDIKLALMGLDINDLIEATIKATSMEQLNNVLDKLIEYKC
jgi:hypothetical protein